MISDPAVCPLLVITPSMRVVGNVSSPGTEPVDTQSSASHSRVLGRGIVQFLATQGGTNPYMNPASSFQLRITSSGWIGPIERLVANVPFVSRSRGIQVLITVGPLFWHTGTCVDSHFQITRSVVVLTGIIF
jgi:hypothetical protein